MILINKLIIISLSLFLCSCAIEQSIARHGINNLDEKEKQFVVGLSNKNDIITKVGNSIIKEYPNQNYWIYFETEEKRKFFGKKETIKNNFLVLEFDDKGILKDKKLYSNLNLNQIELSVEETKVMGIQDNFSKRFFASMKKRFQKKNK